MDYSYNDMITLSISTDVYRKFMEYIEKYNFKIESGGIIAGTLFPAEKKIIMTDLTEPQRKDLRTIFAFKRSEFGHQEIMDKLWEESQHKKTYLGEWHTHNQRIPQPSYIDRRNWIKISQRKQNSDWLFFVIVGTKQIGIWTILGGEIVQVNKVINEHDIGGW